MLTLRQAGAIGIKLLGVSYLARTVLAVFSLVALRFAPSGFGADGDFATAQIVGTLGYPLAAWLLLGTGDDLASRLFPATPVSVGVGARDLLGVGVAIVGLSLAASALPALIQGIGTAIYYAEGTRQQFAEARFDGQWPQLIREALTLVTGLAVAAASRPIASRFRTAPE